MKIDLTTIKAERERFDRQERAWQIDMEGYAVALKDLLGLEGTPEKIIEGLTHELTLEWEDTV